MLNPLAADCKPGSRLRAMGPARKPGSHRDRGHTSTQFGVPLTWSMVTWAIGRWPRRLRAVPGRRDRGCHGPRAPDGQSESSAPSIWAARGVLLPLVGGRRGRGRDRFSRYPPAERRGIGGERAVKWGLPQEYLDYADEEILVIPCDREARAVAAIEVSVLALPGLEAIFSAPPISPPVTAIPPGGRGRGWPSHRGGTGRGCPACGVGAGILEPLCSRCRRPSPAGLSDREARLDAGLIIRCALFRR